MAAYLIDFENVKSEGIKGILQLTENDTVIIFYSVNADTLTFETMDMIFNSKAKLQKYKIIHGGKNSLDFQLTTYLGYLIHEGKDNCFYIISNDHGFQHVVEFWKRIYGYQGYVFCCPTIADAIVRQKRFDSISGNGARSAEMEREQEAQITEADETLEEEEEAELQESEGEPEPIPGPAEEHSGEETEEHAGVYVNETGEAPDENAFHPAAAADLTENISVRLADDSVMIETIHGGEPVSGAVPDSLPEEKEDGAIAEQLARKIAEAVPDSGFRAAVIDDSRTVHRIDPETEANTAEPAGSGLSAENGNEIHADFDAESDRISGLSAEVSGTAEPEKAPQPEHRPSGHRGHHRKHTAQPAARASAGDTEKAAAAPAAAAGKKESSGTAAEASESPKNSETAKQEKSKQEDRRAGNAKSESIKAESGKTGAAKDADSKAGNAKAGSAKAESAKAETRKTGNSKAESAKTQNEKTAAGKAAEKPAEKAESGNAPETAGSAQEKPKTVRSASRRTHRKAAAAKEVPASEAESAAPKKAEDVKEAKKAGTGRAKGRRPKKAATGAADFKDDSVNA